MKSFRLLFKQGLFYFVLALVFLVAYEALRALLAEGQTHLEFPYFSGVYWAAFLIIAFVSGLVWVNSFLGERFLLDWILELSDEIDPDDDSGVFASLLYVLASGSSLSLLYWLLSPLASWALIFFVDSHVNLFSFYLSAWGHLRLVDGLALFAASLLVVALEVLVSWLYQLLRDRHRPEFSR